MRTRIVVGAVTVVATMALGAPPAMAQSTEWAMPDIEGMDLAEAQETFTAATDGVGPEMHYSNDSGPGEVINLTNWTVCWQSPEAGETIDEESWIGVGVQRPNNC